MTELVWDDVGARKFETGVDRGILFLDSTTGIAWNGLTSVEDQSTNESQSHYLDGVKFLERQIPGDYVGTLRAVTYPDEFNEILGIETVFEGLTYHNQVPKSFSLVYRTVVGNDLEGTDHGYKLHILYNLVAIPEAISHQTLGETPSLTEFGWQLKGTPKIIDGFRPTVHISVDSTIDPRRYEALERILYGTVDEDPYLPDIDVLTTLYDAFNNLTIIDNADGTWTAFDPYAVYLTQIDATTWEIDGADITYLNPTTYEITDTDPD